MSNTERRNTRRGSGPARKLFRILAALIVLAGVGGAGYVVWNAEDEPAKTVPTAIVQRGPLTISVTQSGSIESRERVVIKSEVQGRNAILSLVEEGTHVEKGDLLVELDSSSLVEQRDQQQIKVLNAEAAYIRAREDLAVTRSQTESDIAKAELAKRFAELDLKKYIEGEHPQERQKIESDITIAKEELERAAEKATWSKELVKEGFMTETEQKANELAEKRAQIALKLAEGKLALLENYTHKRNLEQLRSDVDQAGKALDRVKRKASADLVQAQAELKARESEFERQKDRLREMTEQIAKCRIFAPVDGMVVHATTGQFRWRGNVEPLAEGQEVRERQELIRLPTTSAMKADIKIHESSLRKVRVGMPVRITIDAMPGRVFWGRLVQVAPVPDSQSMFLNPDLKVYGARVDLEDRTGALRPGMSCRTEIVVQELDDALYVPVQAVARVGTQTVAFVQTPTGEFQQRTVQAGLDNNRVIHVVEGLREGDVVSLAPPLAASAAPQTEPVRTPKELREKGPFVAPTRSAAATTSAPATTTQPAGGLLDPAKLRSMSREQRRKYFQSLTPEQREQLRKQFGGRRTGNGRARGPRDGGEGREREPQPNGGGPPR
jgi:HlyD family secretion protein